MSAEPWWTPERVDAAVALFQRGMSFTEIACEIGCHSRNQVASKLNRLGHRRGISHAEAARLSIRARMAARRPEGNDGKWTPERERRAIELFEANHTYEQIAQSLGFITKNAVQKYLDSSEADVALPESRRVSLMALKPGLCKWPLGDPQSADFCFCGADTDLLTQSYCPSHRLLARGNGTPSERRAVQDAKAVA